MTEDAKRSELIERLLAGSDRRNTLRPQPFESCFPRARAARAIEQVLDLYECRQGSSASIYAAVALTDTIGFKADKIDAPSRQP